MPPEPEPVRQPQRASGRLFDTIRCLLGRSFYDDPNIYRAADLLIWCHGTRNALMTAA